MCFNLLLYFNKVKLFASQFTAAEMISVSYHIKLYFLFGESNGLLILEYVEQGTLFDFLHQNEFNSDRNITWARQIAFAFRHSVNNSILFTRAEVSLSIIYSILFTRAEVSPLWHPRPGSDSRKSEINEWYVWQHHHSRLGNEIVLNYLHVLLLDRVALFYGYLFWILQY